MHHNTKGRPRTTGITDALKTEIYKEYIKGVAVPMLSEKYKCGAASIYRFINDERKRLATVRFHRNRPKY